MCRTRRTLGLKISGKFDLKQVSNKNFYGENDETHAEFENCAKIKMLIWSSQLNRRWASIELMLWRIHSKSSESEHILPGKNNSCEHESYKSRGRKVPRMYNKRLTYETYEAYKVREWQPFERKWQMRLTGEVICLHSIQEHGEVDKKTHL